MKFLWKAKQLDGDFYFFDAEDLPNLGFQSVYAVPDEEAERMQEAKSYAGYKGPVFAGSYLYLDCDDEISLQRSVKTLTTLGLSFDVWDTGNRGGHIRIHRNIERVSLSTEVPATDKAWAEANVPWVDTKLYTRLHLFRRPGAIHEKTGKRKVHKSVTPGETLHLKLVGAPEPKVQQGAFRSVFSGNEIMILSVPYYVGGNRRGRLGKLAIELFRRGQTFDFTHQWVVNVNLLGDPIEEEDLLRLVEWAAGEVYGSQTIRRSGK